MSEEKDPVKTENKPSADMYAEFGDDEEQDFIFQLQMRVYDFVVSNGRNLLYGIGIFLGLVLVYGLWQGHERQLQRDGHDAIFVVALDVPKISDRALQGFAEADNPNDLSRIAKLRESALQMEQVAKDTSGFARGTAFLEAATLWKRAGESTNEQAALSLAIDNSDEEIVKWAANARLSSSQADGGDLEQAAQTLKLYGQSNSSFFAEQATLQAVEYFIELDEKTAATGLLDEYQTAYPAGQMQDKSQLLRAKLGLSVALPEATPEVIEVVEEGVANEEGATEDLEAGQE